MPDPKCHGWNLDEEGNLSIEWMRGSPAPTAVLQLLSCKCSRSCTLPDCTCLANGLRCTDMCKLQTCANKKNEEDIHIELDDSTDESDDE